jgi:hypothetical protein
LSIVRGRLIHEKKILYQIFGFKLGGRLIHEFDLYTSKYGSWFTSIWLSFLQVLAILAAVTEVIKAKGGKESETEYYAALVGYPDFVVKEEYCFMIMLFQNVNVLFSCFDINFFKLFYNRSYS